jgi:hypothetical protein
MTDWLTNSNASASRHASMLAQFAVAIRVASRRLDLSRWSMPSGPRHGQGMLEGSHHSLEGSHHSRL